MNPPLTAHGEFPDHHFSSFLLWTLDLSACERGPKGSEVLYYFSSLLKWQERLLVVLTFVGAMKLELLSPLKSE